MDTLAYSVCGREHGLVLDIDDVGMGGIKLLPASQFLH
jgi:hypothetical protein